MIYAGDLGAVGGGGIGIVAPGLRGLGGAGDGHPHRAVRDPAPRQGWWGSSSARSWWSGCRAGCARHGRDRALSEILAALSPLHAVAFVVDHPALAFLALGAVVLAVTGGGALHRHGTFRPGPDPAGVVRLRVAGPGGGLTSARGRRCCTSRRRSKSPFYHLGPSWAMIPAAGARHPGHGHRLAGGDLGRLLGGPPGGADGAASRMLIVHTSGHEGADLRPLHQLDALPGGGRTRGRLPELVEPRCGIRHRGDRHDADRPVLLGFVMVLIWRWRPAAGRTVRGGSCCWWTSPSSAPTRSRFPRAAGSRSRWRQFSFWCSPPGARASPGATGDRRAERP